MRRNVSWITTLSYLALSAPGLFAAPPSAPVRTSTSQNGGTISSTDPESQQLLQKLTQISEQITQHAQSADGWKYQLDQGSILLQLAIRAKADERDSWLKMAIDSYHSAVTQSPEKETLAQQRLAILPGWIAARFPGNPNAAYAALQKIRAEHMLALMKAGDKSEPAKEHYAKRLLTFAQDYPKAPQAPNAVQEAAQLSETMGKTDDARRYYRYLAENYSTLALGRKASGSLWRLGAGHETMNLKLPLLFAADARGEQLFDVKALRGRVVVLYFWTSTSAGVEDDFEALRRLTNRPTYRRLEVVYVNLDPDTTKAREFLSGKLTSGTHVYQRGGMDSPVAEQHGIHTIPQAFVVARDGVLVRHSLKTTQLDVEVLSQFPGSR